MARRAGWRAIEAGLALGRDLFPGQGEGFRAFVGMTGFGASGPYKKLHEALRDRRGRRCASGAKRVKRRMTELRAKVPEYV